MQLLVRGKTPQQFFDAVQWRLQLEARKKRLANLRKKHRHQEESWISNTHSIQYYLSSDQAREIILRHPQDHLPLISEADRICKGETEVPGFGKRSIVLSQYHHMDTAEAYAYRLLCRLDFFHPLVRSYIIRGDEPVYLSTIEQLIFEWAKTRSQPGEFDSVDEAIRILNLLTTLALTQGDLSDQAFKAGIKSVADAAWTVELNRARTGNHLIYEGLALFYAGSCLTDHFRSDSWRDLGKSIIENEMHQQILEDGMNGELCTSYHLITGTNFLKGWILGEKTDNGFSETYINRLAKMALVATRLKASDGGFWAFGDSDRMKGTSREEREANAFADLGRTIISEGVDKDFSLELDLLLADMDFSKLKAAELQLGESPFCAGGYHMLKDTKGNSLIFDVGPFGLSGASHHGHADSLSFITNLEDGRFLVDPGGFSYVDEEARNYARSTAAHNTIRIDGKDSSVITGSFSYGRAAKARLTHYSEIEHGIVLSAEHNGYARLPAPVIHRRGLVWLKRQPFLLLVFDRLEGTNRHLIESSFHGDAGWQVESDDGSALVWNRGDRTVLQQVWSDSNLSIDIVVGETDPEWQGWISPAFGVYLEAPVVVQRCESEIPTEIVNVFLVADNSSPDIIIKNFDNSVLIADELKLYWKWGKDRLSIDFA